MDSLLYRIYNHLVLPPQLPGEQDENLERISYEVTKRVISACNSVGSLADQRWSQAFQCLHVSLTTCIKLNTGRLEKATLLQHFSQLEVNHLLILHIVEQNAALLIRREVSEDQDCIIFESFEASVASEQVLSAGQAMQWDFPGRSAQIPLGIFLDQTFQDTLAGFLEQASIESLHSLRAQAQKAGVSIAEIRDTTSPALITQMLIPLLEALGDHFQAPVLRKRVRDDVNITKGNIPWRRLPFWLILRVAIQRQLCLLLGSEQGRICYKFIMCMLFSDLLSESTGSLRPELVILLRTKLCRRMAKLEIEKTETKPADRSMYEILLRRISPVLKGVIKDTTIRINTAWDSFKERTTRIIPQIPLRAADDALPLLLPNSGNELERLLWSSAPQRESLLSLDLPKPLDKAIKNMQELTGHIYNLAAKEVLIRREANLAAAMTNGHEKSKEEYANECIKLDKQMKGLLDDVGSTFDSDPEQMSSVILSIFTLWVQLDASAIGACSILADHCPVFHPEILDALQLPTVRAMRNLREIQAYLTERHKKSRFGSILADIDPDCLAVRYVSRSRQMKDLGTRIQHASDRAREVKESEWRLSCQDYDRHTEGAVTGTCCCTFRNGERIVRGCTKCWHWRVRNRMEIQVHEAFLPEKDPQKSNLIFELGIPSYISAYRNATWRIVKTLAHPGRLVRSPAPVIELRGCEPLRSYFTAEKDGISLGSAVKCFQQTHYKFSRGKAPLSSVILPFGARFELYDSVSGLWVKDLKEPLTFEHLCGVQVPRGLRDTVLPIDQHPPSIVDGPSSYQIQANESECPANLSVHEFSACQKLLAGKLRRWPNILVEMGSSNLNFSSEETTRLICQLAVQAGPGLLGEDLRATHAVFKEPVFLERLMEIVEKHLDAISTNWREHSHMELLITLALRVVYLSSGVIRERGIEFLRKARHAILDWTVRLRVEVQSAVDDAVATRATTYGFHAALLCRRTFAYHIELNQAISSDDLISWVRASVALQENISIDISKLPPVTKRMLIRDSKMSLQLWPLLKSAMCVCPHSVGDGIRMCWSDTSDNVFLDFTEWIFMASPDNFWIVARMAESQGTFGSSRVVHYHLLEGHLLVNKKPRGKLPLEIRNDSAVRELFGNQHLLTYPSSLSGMSHQLTTPIRNRSVHFGLRREKVVIRLSSKEDLLEYVPREIFTSPKDFDLPAELLDNCVHWVNIRTKCLEIRRKPEIWVRRQRDWVIDLRTRLAFRDMSSILVNPQSETFRKIAKAFEHFERPEKLTVYQPQAKADTSYQGKLAVELRHFDLSFFVNRRGLLECRQLKAEMDPNQDVGTWYGLEGKIVLRDVITKKRSIIVPLGKITIKKHGMHVKVRVEEASNYGRYMVDGILNRLSCPPEMRLLYSKALYHAATSFCLPDSLTGRTGTEEAFYILRSGAAQPWTAQKGSVINQLKTLATLSPRREYYPPHIKRLQKVMWDSDMTMTIQHDGYEPLIEGILERLNRLAEFDNSGMKGVDLTKPSHLRHRGEMRQRLYQRTDTNISGQATGDMVCGTRDRKTKPHAGRVYEVARLVVTGCRDIGLTTQLISILESWNIINGFNGGYTYSPHVKPLVNQIGDPMNEQWGDLIEFCRQAESPVSVIFRLGLLAFASNPDMDTLRMLAAFSCIDELKILKPPAYSIFPDFVSRGKPSVDILQKLIIQSRSSVSHDHGLRDRFQSMKLAAHLLSQWPIPSEDLSIGPQSGCRADAITVLSAIAPEWDRRKGNMELENYVKKVQIVLESRRGSKIVFAPPDQNHAAVELSKRLQTTLPSTKEFVVNSCRELGDVRSTMSLTLESGVRNAGISKVPTSKLSSELQELEEIVSRFAKSDDDLRTRYGTELLQSLSALKDTNYTTRVDHGDSTPSFSLIANTMEHLYQTVASYLGHISVALYANGSSMWMKLGDILPCKTPIEILELIRSTTSHRFGPGMKEALVEYGLAIAYLQRICRIRDAFLRDQIQKERRYQNLSNPGVSSIGADGRVMREEIRNIGHQNWSPLQNTDWLLMEIESDILIRPEQVDVARAIIEPESGQNSVIQMNMGKGKTSCIVPMVIAVLANGDNLSRLIVPKALLTQTAQMVQSRLGGLVGREICHVPFSRKTRTTPEMLEQYAQFHHKMHQKRGLILTSHESILSYQLSGWQHAADGKLKTASTMTQFQEWLNHHARDVLDECDFTLSVKTQLNYPGGSEMVIDGQPYRWEIAQELLALAADHVAMLRKDFPRSIDVQYRSGSYPVVHFLKSGMEDRLRDRILRDICSGKTNILHPTSGSFSRWQTSVTRVLSSQRPTEAMLIEASNAFSDPQTASKTLLIIRGLVVNKILFFCLSRRWNVQYGLHPGRDPIAVPFEAKGTPSEQSEFGHPDVAILFTCLSFYYTGLPLEYLRRSIKQVLQSDDPDLQYGWWTSGCKTLPESLKHWRAINVEDAGQMEDMWRYLRFNRTVINYYMNNFVFPTYARQFETKLQASSWDIPLVSETKSGVKTTGFSGTNDNRTMLPLTIRQDELPGLRQTNAEVLAYLLQERNRGYQVTVDRQGKRLSEIDLLKQLQKSNIRVLIDAGAYILEMDNKTLAEKWLHVDTQAKAAIYFGKDSKAQVHYKGDANEDIPLLASPFVDDLSECVVYLDEAHTRGVDLKFPADAHGALTLAPKQTKDFTMQAAMRLRQLRSTQRVTFFAPPEVDQSIRDLCHPKRDVTLDSSHVITWLLEQTCRGLVDMQGLYVAQGIDFCHRADATSLHRGSISNPERRNKLLRILKQPEHQTLEQMYGHDTAKASSLSTDGISSPQLREFLDKLLQSRDSTGINQTGVFEVVEVEREREVQNQVEQVRQIQKPPRYAALKFPGLHRALLQFTQTGKLDKSAFVQAFTYLSKSNIGRRHNVHSTESALFVSKEFEKTINVLRSEVVDNFLRPVEWILWSPEAKTAVVIIPEEAELLIPDLRLHNGRSPVHLIAYAAPVSKTMGIFNEFRYYSLPELPKSHSFPDWFRVELGILSGRLYVDSVESELLIRRIQPNLSNGAGLAWLADDPAHFILEWLSLRRKSQNVTHTPMGYICTGRNPEAGHVL